MLIIEMCLFQAVRISEYHSPVQLWCLSPSWFQEGQEDPHRTPLTATKQKVLLSE
jgi:hypothetical protein